MLMRVRERISRGVITPFILFIYYEFVGADAIPVYPIHFSHSFVELFLLLHLLFARVGSFFFFFCVIKEFLALSLSLLLCDFSFFPFAIHSRCGNVAIFQPLCRCLKFLTEKMMRHCAKVCYRSLSVLLTQHWNAMSRNAFRCFQSQWMLNWNLSPRRINVPALLCMQE